MATFLIILTCLLFFQNQVQSQIIRSPLSFINRPITEAILDPQRSCIDGPRAYAETPRNYIELPLEASRNFNIPRIIDAPRFIEPSNGLAYPNVPGIPNLPSTTIITDCTPSVCKNLANTINLMIVCNLLQNTKGSDEIAVQFAAPLLREIISNPTGAISSTTTVSSLLNANAIIPNILTSNVVPSNLIAPNYISPNPVSPCNCPNNGVLISSLLKALSGGV